MRREQDERETKLGPWEESALLAPIGRIVSRTRFVVLIVVAAVLAGCCVALLAGHRRGRLERQSRLVGSAPGHLGPEQLSLSFLKAVRTMLEAVVFFLVGVGLYGLFIVPLRLAEALGVDTLNDLEERVTSVAVAILAVTFVEHFIQWERPLETLQFGAALALAVSALVLFQIYSHRVTERRSRQRAQHDAASHE